MGNKEFELIEEIRSLYEQLKEAKNEFVIQ